MAAHLQMKSPTLQAAVVRFRPILNQALRDRWWTPEKRIRPKPLPDTHFPFIGALGDVVSLHIFHPRLNFSEAKIFYDKKNSIYALKKEVVVTAQPPHYALFAQKSRVGAKHDYVILKESYQSYLPYLEKTPTELQAIPEDQNPNWAMLLDHGYVGPAEDTPGLRRVTPKKGTLSVEEQHSNAELGRLRVPVEQFFGRMQQLWALSRGIYRWSHDHFDLDIDNCILLTNEVLKRRNNPLATADQQFAQKVRADRKRKQEEKAEKKQESATRYRANKRRRLGQT